MNKKIKIRKVSAWSIGITILLAILFLIITVQGGKEFKIVQDSTNRYIVCERAAKNLQDGSNYLTEQVRLYAMTGEQTYLDNYFQEVNETRRRDKAVKSLQRYFQGTDPFNSLQKAMDCSEGLMSTEYYSMRLVLEAQGTDSGSWPEEIQKVTLSAEDSNLTSSEKMQKARQIVSDDVYQETREEITGDVSNCMEELIKITKNRQGRATMIFSDIYLKIEIGISILIVLLLVISIMIRRLVVNPLISYNESIQRGEIFPVIGAEELQNLAETYNKVYKENKETQMLIRHQAEHDALTGVFNRGAFEKLLKVHEKAEEQSPFALILIDVDTFKSVNDTYGHAVGDEILKKVASLLRSAFRSIDFVCRIGGDEFSIIMVEMTMDLAYTIKEKIQAVNEELANPKSGLPAVSLSVGVAFTDRENPGESLFKDADKALYFVKENGRSGCKIY